MTVCNMSIEWGARAGMVAPDDTTFAWFAGPARRAGGPRRGGRVVARARRPTRAPSTTARRSWTPPALAPQVTWGTHPGMVAPVTGRVPTPDDVAREDAEGVQRALEYMGLHGGEAIEDIAIDAVFIGSCTNGRLPDLRAAAEVVRGRRVAAGVRAMVVPGSMQVKAEAEAEGLDEVFRAAGFEWRDAGCSMCLAMNDDVLRRGRALRLDQQPQLRGPAGQGRPHPPRQPADGGRGSDRRAPGGRALVRRRAGGGGLMDAFTRVEGVVCPLDRGDVDTDQIIPKQFLKRIERTGFGEFLFWDWRGQEGFPLDRPEYAGAPILVTGRNFGCGSSREHAPWALQDHGFRAIIAPELRRHLPHQLHEDRPAAGDAAGRRGRRPHPPRHRPARRHGGGRPRAGSWSRPPRATRSRSPSSPASASGCSTAGTTSP